MKWSPLLVLIITFVIGCNSNDTKVKKEDDNQTNAAPSGKMEYDLSHPAQKWVLPNELLEISGNPLDR